MIPILVGLGIAAAGVYSIGSQVAINDLKNDIENINDKARDKINETKKLIEVTNNKLDKVYNVAAEQKKYIYSTTLKRAKDIVKRIKVNDCNIEFKNEIRVISSNMSSIKESTLPQVANIAAIGLTGVISNVVGFGIGGIIGNTIVGVAMAGKVDEAEEQYSKIKAECEMAKIECTKRKNLARNIADTVNVVGGLNDMLNSSLDNAERILNEKGYDMSKWTSDEADTIMTLLDLVKATADIINSNIVTDTGEMSSEYTDKVDKQKRSIIDRGYDIPDRVTVD